MKKNASNNKINKEFEMSNQHDQGNMTQFEIEGHQSEFKTSLLRKIQSLYNREINKKEKKQTLLMERIE